MCHHNTEQFILYILWCISCVNYCIYLRAARLVLKEKNKLGQGICRHLSAVQWTKGKTDFNTQICDNVMLWFGYNYV